MKKLIKLGIIFIHLVMSMAYTKETSDNSSTHTIYSFLPESIETGAWKLRQPVVFYYSDNLWEYIDGKAELFLAYNFQCVGAAEYQNNQKPDKLIIVDIYRLGDVNDAFGVYALERSPDCTFINIDSEGYISFPAVNFYKGQYYIKLLAYDIEKEDKANLISLAHVLARNIQVETELPPLLRSFLENDKVNHSERFYRSDFMAVQGLNAFFTADYKIQGSDIRLFLHAPKVDSRLSLPIIKEKMKQSGMKQISDDTLLNIDRTHLIIIMAAHDMILGGITENNREELLRKKLQKMIANLKE